MPYQWIYDDSLHLLLMMPDFKFFSPPIQKMWQNMLKSMGLQQWLHYFSGEISELHVHDFVYHPETIDELILHLKPKFTWLFGEEVEHMICSPHPQNCLSSGFEKKSNLADMAKNTVSINQKGYLLLEWLTVLLILQILFLSVWPSMQQLSQMISAKITLQTLRRAIEWARWEAILTQQTLSMKPIGGDWGKGWTLEAKQKPLRVEKPWVVSHVPIVWHGFKKEALRFYPEVTQNHLNGYFQILHQQLYLNRFGHTRINHVL